MTTIVTIIFLAISIFISAFLNFSPNFQRLVKNDFMRRAYSNAILYGLEYGQLATRAKTISTNPNNNSKGLSLGYLNKKDNIELDRLDCTVSLDNNWQIHVDVRHIITSQ